MLPRRFLTRLASLLMLLALTAAIGAPGITAATPPGPQIRLLRTTFDPANGAPALAPSLQLSEAQRAQATYFLVQFRSPLTAAHRKVLAQQGAQIVDYVPDYAYVVRLSAQAAARLDSAALGLNYVGVVEPAYKLDLSLDNRSALPLVGEEDRRVRLQLMTWPGERATTVASQVAALGGELFDVAENRLGGVIRLGIDASQIEALAFLNGVAWVEPWHTPVLHNDVARGIIRADVAQGGLGLYGEGQIAAVADTGLDSGNPATLHPDFSTHLLVGYAWGRATDPNGIGDTAGDWSDGNGHGTHVAGSLLGDGSASGADPTMNSYGGSHAGVAPRASLVFQSIADTAGDLVGVPSDLNLLFRQAYDAGARIHSNSWGSAVAGAYTGQSRQVDQFLWDHPDMYINFSSGNEGEDSNANGVVDPTSLGAPASAKNVLTVGASENQRNTGGLNPGGFCTTYFDCFGNSYPTAPINADRLSNNPNGMVAFSSRGPAQDGRLKPDVVAPGTNILSAASQMPTADTSWGDGPSIWYGYEGGTSMSTPLTAGAATLIRQYYTDLRGLGAPSGSLLKATLINGAVDMAPGQYGVGATQDVIRRPDANQGWGRVSVAGSVMPTAPNTLWFDDHTAGLSTGQVVTYTRVFTVGPDLPAGSAFRATLAWADYPGSLIAQTKLVNDLDLQVIAPNGTFYGNDRYGDGALDGDLDRLNNVEGVEIVSPIPGAYTVVVRAFNVPQGSQRYALVISGPSGGVHLSPPRPAQTVIAGRSHSYNLTVRNSSGSTQSFALSTSGATWPTVLSAATTGPLANGAEFNFTATVTVPTGTASDTEETATVIAQAGSVRDEAQLYTRSALEAVRLTPGDSSRAGAPGFETVFPQTLTNRSGATRSFALSVSGNLWPTVIEDSQGNPITQSPALAPDSTFSFNVVVTVPLQTLAGKRDWATLTAQATDLATLKAQASLQTTVDPAWQIGTDTPVSVEEATLVSDGSKLHLLGGMIGLFSNPAVSNGHAIYDPQTASWTTKEPMPTPLYSADGCVMNGMLFLPGGRINTTTSGYSGIFRVYDITNDFWATRATVTTVSGGTQPIRYQAICDPSFGAQGAVYLIGGANRAGSLAGLTGVYRYNVATNSWAAMAAMPGPRGFAYAGLINGKIYVTGGQTDISFSSALNTTVVYDIATNSWTSGPALPLAMTGGGSAVVNNKLYVFGGRAFAAGNQFTTGASYELDPATGTWRQLASLNWPRYGVTGDALGGLLYAATGVYDSDFPKTNFEYLPAGETPVVTLSGTKSSPAVVAPSESFTYTIVVTATGTTGLTAARLTDTLPSAVTYAGGLSATVSGSPVGTAAYDAPSRTVTWTGPLTLTAPLRLTFAATVNPDATPGEYIANTAWLDDGEQRADSRQTIASALQVAGVSLQGSTKQVSVAEAGYGQTLEYTLQLVNRGTTSGSATLSDTLPVGLTFGAFLDDDGGNATYNSATRRITWSGTLAPRNQRDYALQPTTYNWSEIAIPENRIDPGEWIATTSNYDADDEGYAVLTLPWDFPFYGERYQTLYVDANGMVGFQPFDLLTANADLAIPNPALPNARIAVHPVDIDLATIGSGGGQAYTFFDQANDRFIVEFKDAVSAFGGSAGTWQIILEPSGRAVIQHQLWGQWEIYGPIGAENQDGSQGVVDPRMTLPDSSAIEILPAYFGSPEIRYTATVNEDAPFGAAITNVAMLTAGAQTEALSASVALRSASLHLAKHAHRPAAALGHVLTYTLSLFNSAALNGLATISDTLPAGLAYVPGSATNGATYDENSQTLTWQGVVPAANYSRSVATDAAAFQDISAIGTPTGLGDEDSQLLTLPFPFRYYGELYTETAIVANGYLQMFRGSPPIKYVYAQSQELGTSVPNNIIAPFWDDLDPTPTSLAPTPNPTIFYATLGTAPARRFIVQWQAVPRYGAAPTAANTFQVILHEADGRIQFAYKQMSALGSQAAIGIEDATGTRVSQHSYNTASVSNGMVISFTPTTPAQVAFRAQVVAPATVGTPLTNTVTGTDGARTVSASATVAIVAAPCADLGGTPGVGIDDIQKITSRWGATHTDTGWDYRYDLDLDGVITAADMLSAANAWMTTCQ